MKKSTLKTISIVILFLTNLNSYKTQTISTKVGNGAANYSGDGGQAILSSITSPIGILIDSINNLYVSDFGNNVIRKVNSSGIITTIAGTGALGYSGDGGPATLAEFQGPAGLVSDKYGNIYIADEYNNTIRKINTAGVISTIAGTGLSGYSGDGGPAALAELNYPWGLAIDAAGNLYVADQSNNCIRKINTSGIITTIAGNGTAGFSGDGGLATLAEINQSSSVAVDIAGNIYISEMVDNRIRKINTSGIINTIAGNGIAGFSGDGGAAISAQLHYPVGLHIDNSGNLYVNDYLNYRIRKINSAGIISTVTGNGTSGYSGDNGLASLAQISGSWATTTDASGNLYLSDFHNNRIRSICSANCVTNMNPLGKSNIINVFPNPNNGNFKLKINIDSENIELVIINSLGESVYLKKLSQGLNSINTNLSEGFYNYIILQDKLQIGTGKLSVE